MILSAYICFVFILNLFISNCFAKFLENFVMLCNCLQGPSCPDPSEVYVDTKSLRYDRVSILEKGSPNSLCLKESGKVSIFTFIQFSVTFSTLIHLTLAIKDFF